jgi:uncharacterized protein YceK
MKYTLTFVFLLCMMSLSGCVIVIHRDSGKNQVYDYPNSRISQTSVHGQHPHLSPNQSMIQGVR